VAIGAGVVIDDGVKIGKNCVIDSGYQFGADFYQFCRVGSLPHRFLWPEGNQSRLCHFGDFLSGPDGDYVIIQFDTSFENKKSAIETVTPMLDKDGVWRVSGYYIK